MDMAGVTEKDMKLGINGLGRIGKLTVWHHVARKYFNELVVNIGREAGTSLEDIAHYVERDSTYGLLHGFLYGQKAASLIGDLDEKSGSMDTCVPDHSLHGSLPENDRPNLPDGRENSDRQYPNPV